jgi:ornithine decarboxylase
MHGPFMLPKDVREGDWIEIGQLGAYGSSLRTSFNGFDQAILAEVRDPAMLETSGYQAEEIATPADVTKLPLAYPRAA